MVILSYLLIFICKITSPHLEKAEPNPYFQFSIMPPAYWIGVCTSVIALLISVFPRKEDDSHSALGLSALLSLTIYTNVIPRLMYKNLIWHDTYPSVGELAYILTYGRTSRLVPFHTLMETPALSLFSSQLTLVMGLDYLVIVEFISLLVPLIMTLFVYSLAQSLTGGRAAIIAALVYIGCNQFGFYFNRGSFSLTVQLLTWYCIVKLMMSRKRLWAVILVLSYIALVLSHPIGAFITIVITIAPFVLTRVRFFIFDLFRSRNDNHVPVQGFAGEAYFWRIALIQFTIWGSWHLLFRHANFLVTRVLQWEKLFPRDPADIVSATGYTSEYYPIVMLSFYELVLLVIIGSSLALLFVFQIKFDWRAIISSSWFISAILFVPPLYLLRMAQYADRFLAYSFPVFGILIAQFLSGFSSAQIDRSKKILNMGKTALLALPFSFILLSPLTMYPNMAFVYPSTASLKLTDYYTKKAWGSVVVIGGHEETAYYRLINNAKAQIFHLIDVGPSPSAISYDVIAITYRAYAKDRFTKYQPSITQYLRILQERLNIDLGFARIYVSESNWSIMYAKQ